MFLSLSKSITLPDRYARHPAIIRPLTVPNLSRICPLPGLLSTRMFRHVDGYSYSLKSILPLRLKPCNRSKAAKAATGLTPAINGGACAPLSGQRLDGKELAQRNIFTGITVLTVGGILLAFYKYLFFGTLP